MDSLSSTATLTPEYRQGITRADQIRYDYHHKQIIEAISCLHSEFNMLLTAFNERLSYDQEKEMAFNRLYAELDALKQDQELNHFRSIYVDLILLIDRMNMIYNDKLDSGKTDPDSLELLSSLSHEVLEVLYRRGVELVVSTSEYFDPKIQQAVQVVLTSNASDDGKVIEMVRHGFKYNDILLRPEEVVIMKYES